MDGLKKENGPVAGAKAPSLPRAPQTSLSPLGAASWRSAPTAPPALPSRTPAPATATPPREAKPAVPFYGITRAIEMMRKLPETDIELVVDVVKIALESANIEVAAIIEDATRQETGIEHRVDILRGEIGDLEQQIATRQQEIAKLEASQQETSKVKQRLILAEQRVHDSGATIREGVNGHKNAEPHSAPEPAANSHLPEATSPAVCS